MKRIANSSFFRRIRGFTLIEVIIGSMVIASFVGGTVFMAGQISEARIGGLAQRDRSAWANLQTQLAAEGIDATSTNSAVWTGKGFDTVGQGTGDRLAVASTSAGLSEKELGKGMVVRPFRIDLSMLGQRSNMNTVGFVIMDRNTAGLSPVAMDKPPGDPFTIGATFRIVVYDPVSDSYHLSSIDLGKNGASSASLDALTDLNWNDPSGPQIYLVAKPATADPLDNLRVQTSGTANSSSPSLGSLGGLPAGFSLPEGWSFGGRIDASPLAGGSSTLVVSYVAQAGGLSSEPLSFSIDVAKVTPTAEAVVKNADGSTRESGKVTLYDILPSMFPAISAADQLLMNSGQLEIKLYADTAKTIPIPAALDSQLSITNTVGSVSLATTGSASTGYTSRVVKDCFTSTAQHPWRIQLLSTNPFVADLTKTDYLSAQPSTLPRILLDKPSQSFADPLLYVTLSAENTLGLHGISDKDIYDICYTFNTSSTFNWQLASKYIVGSPIPVGRDLTFFTSSTLRAKARTSYTALLNIFLIDAEETLAVYTKQPASGGFEDQWNYAGRPAEAPTYDEAAKTVWSFIDSNTTVLESWKARKVPNAVDANAMFSYVIPVGRTVTVDGAYTLGGLFFQNSDRSFTLARRSSGSTSITFDRTTDNAEITVVGSSEPTINEGDHHVVNADIILKKPVVANVVGSDMSLTLNGNISKDANQSHGFYKTGAGSFEVGYYNAKPQNYTTNQTRNIRYVVQQGELKLKKDGAITHYQDDAAQSPVLLDGGRFALAGFDQTFQGRFRVTKPSQLSFGGTAADGALFTVENVDIASSATLRIYDYQYSTASGWTTKDKFYSKYPGLAALRSIQYPELINTFYPDPDERPANPVIYARWIGTNVSSTGEIVPRRPPTSTGFAYLTVSKTSRIFFKGASKLSVQDIMVYEGAILEIRNWGTGDVLTVECQATTDTSFDITSSAVRGRIKFYNDSNVLLNTGAAKLESITVTRRADNGTTYTRTIYKVVP